MLKQLRVKNFALIEDALLEFERGLNVLTGETGAGKSILIEALGFALGARLEAEWLRPSKTLAVEAVFEIKEGSPLERELKGASVSPEEEIITIRREADESGKSKSFLNGVLTTASQIKMISGLLVDIFGQREGQILYDTGAQAKMLDEFAGLREEVDSYGGLFTKRAELLSKKQSLIGSLAQKEREMDLLEYQIREIESARIDPEKDLKLEDFKVRLASAEKLGKIYEECSNRLFDDDHSAFSMMGQVNRVLTNLTRIDPSEEVKKLCSEASEIEIRIGELVNLLKAYGSSLEHDPARLEEVMERIHLLDKLKKKYGTSLENILKYLDEAKQRFEMFETSDASLKQFDVEIEALERAMEKKTEELSQRRRKTAEKLRKDISNELESLEMKGSQFEIQVTDGDFNPRGKNEIEFLLSANKGEELKSLAKVASGGEASRIQLALKKIFSKVEPVGTFVFDEIDSGIGGRLGPAIGEKLKDISKNRSVISITHLAPVASQAACHILAFKKTEKGETRVLFERLEGDKRVEEIAKMLSGKKLTEASIEHAKEILNA